MKRPGCASLNLYYILQTSLFELFDMRFINNTLFYLLTDQTVNDAAFLSDLPLTITALVTPMRGLLSAVRLLNPGQVD